MSGRSNTSILQMLWAERPDVRSIQYANLARFFSLFIIGVILIRTGVTKSDVGYFELVLFSINIGSFLWLNGARRAAESWWHADKHVERPVAGIVMAYQCYGILAALLAILATDYFIGTMQPSRLLYWAVGLYAYFFVSSSIIDIWLVWKKKPVTLVILSFCFYFSQAIIVVLIYREISDLSKSFAWLAGLAGLKWLLGWYFLRNIQRRKLRVMLPYMIFSIPLVLEALFGGLMPYIDGWIVSRNFGTDIFTLYQYGARELPVNAILVAGMVSALVVSYRNDSHQIGSAIRKECNRIMVILVPMACVLLLISPELFLIVYGDKDFVLSAQLFNIYTLILISRLVVPHIYLLGNEDGHFLTWAAAGETLLNIVLSLLFLHWFGIVGIPIATVIVFTLHKVFLSHLVKARYGVKLSDYLNVKYFVISTTLIISSFILAQVIHF